MNILVHCFFFFIKPENSKDLNLSAFEWMDIEDIQMQLVDSKVSLSWKSKFIDLRKLLKTIENKQKNILTCWESLPEKFSCLKKMAIALLSAFGSIYLCEQIFSHMKFILSAHCSRLMENQSELCVQQKVSKFIPDISELSKEKQGQGSH